LPCDVYIVLETHAKPIMQHYKHYKTVDFLSDDNFTDWVRNPRPDNNLYWQEVFTLFPFLKTPAEEARQIILLVRVKPIDAVTGDLQEAILNKAFETDKIIKEQRIFLFRNFSKWVAAALIVVVSGLLLWQKLAPRLTKLEVVVAKDAGTKQVRNSSNMALLVQLPDQSTVILQPKSYLRYQTDSFTFKREVYLTGDAFFDISKNEKSPFVVNTDQLHTTVLGTSFFVHAKPNMADHQVLVTSGAVRIKKRIDGAKSLSKGPNDIVIKAGEETRTQQNHSLTAVPSLQALHIKEDLGKAFDFQNIPMNKVAETIQRHYGVSVQIESPVLAKRTITAFLGSVSLQEKLDLIAKAIEAHYQLEDGVVVFTLN